MRLCLEILSVLKKNISSLNIYSKFSASVSLGNLFHNTVVLRLVIYLVDLR